MNEKEKELTDTEKQLIERFREKYTWKARSGELEWQNDHTIAEFEAFLLQEVRDAVADTANKICTDIDHIESTDKNTSMEQWKNYKRIRNTIRDKYVLQVLKGGKEKTV